MGSSRHFSRVLALQTIFAYEFHGGDPEALLLYIINEFEGKISDSSFAYELVNGVCRHLPELREAIALHAPQWPVDKIAGIDRAVLEIAIFEIQYSKDVPPVVAIDEAIELAKSFGNESSPKFVNGVLNTFFNAQSRSQKT